VIRGRRSLIRKLKFVVAFGPSRLRSRIYENADGKARRLSFNDLKMVEVAGVETGLAKLLICSSLQYISFSFLQYAI
jgi:hypothetical protein